MAALDAQRIRSIFAGLGERLVRPTTLCLIGSAPGIASGQPARQTADIDLWHPASDYDAGDLERASRELGVLYDPRGELDPDKVYLQVVRPGIVRLPEDFAMETIGRFGKLTVVMPSPAVLVAAKLTRGTDEDIEDAVWWVGQRRMDVETVEAGIRQFPDVRDREAALENLTLVRLAKG